MLRCGEQASRGLYLHEAAVFHHGDVVGEFTDDREVVADQQQRQAGLLQQAQQAHDLGLNGCA